MDSDLGGNFIWMVTESTKVTCLVCWCRTKIEHWCCTMWWTDRIMTIQMMWRWSHSMEEYRYQWEMMQRLSWMPGLAYMSTSRQSALICRSEVWFILRLYLVKYLMRKIAKARLEKTYMVNVLSGYLHRILWFFIMEKKTSQMFRN